MAGKLPNLNLFTITIFLTYSAMLTIIQANPTTTARSTNSTDTSELDRSLNVGILPVLTGMPCFTAYKVAWFHSSTGEHIRCHCDLSSLKEIPLFSALLTWDCDHLMATTTPTPAVIYVTVTPPKIVDSPKFTIRSDPTTKSSLDFDYDVFNLRPKEKEENVEHISTSTQKSEGFGLNDETKNMCNYCVQNWPDDSYKCIPATTLECLTEIKKYEGEQIPVNCMSDYARVYTSKERKACLVEMETQRIYMIFFV